MAFISMVSQRFSNNSVEVWNRWHEVDATLATSYILANWVLMGLNFYWFNKIFSQAKRRLAGSKTADNGVSKKDGIDSKKIRVRKED
jgi:hypothetical protein